jgi:transposase-like protein
VRGTQIFNSGNFIIRVGIWDSVQFAWWLGVLMADVTCPACKGDRLEKYGNTKAGLQKYRCLDPKCRRQFVPGASHLVDKNTKQAVTELLKANVKPNIIAKATPGVSRRWIYDLRKRMKNDRTEG